MDRAGSLDKYISSDESNNFFVARILGDLGSSKVPPRGPVAIGFTLQEDLSKYSNSSSLIRPSELSTILWPITK